MPTPDDSPHPEPISESKSTPIEGEVEAPGDLPGQDLELHGLGFDPDEVVRRLFDNVNFGGPEPEGDIPSQIVSVFFRAVRMYSGPVPPPEIMAGYAEIDPSFPGRFIAMAEKQSEHRMALETERLKSDGGGQRVGLIMGFILILSALVCGTVIILEGKSGVGFSIIVIAAVGLGAVFRTDLKRLKMSLGRKAKISVRASGTNDLTKEKLPDSQPGSN
jgi:uncharacterized membrane protein